MVTGILGRGITQIIGQKLPTNYDRVQYTLPKLTFSVHIHYGMTQKYTLQNPNILHDITPLEKDKENIFHTLWGKNAS